jgi:protein gp37
MGNHTEIEWTDATWNVITGCSVISPGCANCYAMRLAGTRLRHHPSRKGLTVDRKAGPVWNGEVRFNEQWLTEPLTWKRPRQIFVCAHSDLFHENVPDAWIDRVFAVMALAPQHRFQVLTKRAARMRQYVETRSGDTVYRNMAVIRTEQGGDEHHYRVDWPLPNVWLGVSAEDQARAEERIPDLLATPARVHFVSLEPLLGPIDLTAIKLKGVVDPFDALVGATWNRPPSLNGARFFSGTHPREDRAKVDWVIVGGENGPRPMHPNWAGSIRDQCHAVAVPFFFKQWGTWAPAPWKLERLPGEATDAYKTRSEAIAATHGVAIWGHACKLDHAPWSIERADREPPEHTGMRIAGKRAAGRILDGRTWDEMPGVAA